MRALMIHPAKVFFFKLERDMWSQVKTFIIFLNRLPEYPKTYIHDIQVDLNCFKELQRIYNKDEENR